MKLICSPASPFARKVRTALIQAGLEDQVDVLAHHPLDAGETVIRAHNPLGQVPVLVTEDEGVLYDSAVIIDYIAARSPETGLLPIYGDSHYRTVMRRQALADGIMTAIVGIMFERRRENSQQAPGWQDRRMRGVRAGLDAIEAEMDTLSPYPCIDALSIACLPDYADLRISDLIDWREGHPKLEAWFASLAGHDALTRTHPETGTALT